MIVRRFLFALSLVALLAAPSMARADEDDWHHDGGWQGRHEWYEREHRHHWENGYRHGYEDGYEDAYRWNRDPHTYWSPYRHCWIHDSSYYWDDSEYHWVPASGGNFVLIHLNL